MSYQQPAYVPPPPPDAGRRSTSPWVYVGVGCLALVLLVMGLIGFAVWKVSRMITAPVDKQEVLRSLGPVPVYPKATFDETTTKIANATGSLMKGALGGKSMTGAAFRVPAAPKTVIAWYDTQLYQKSYHIIRTRQNTVNAAEGQSQRQYFKQGEAVIVQAQPAPEDRGASGGDNSLVMVMRIQGITKAPPGAGSSSAD